MQIKIKEVGEVEDMGKYSQFALKYLQDGQEKERTLRSFVFPEVYHMLLKAKTEEIYEIKLVKDGKYWNWAGASLATGSNLSSGKGESGFTKKSTGEWETREERAARQVLIVRQSCISSAAAFLASGGESPEEVIKLAKTFEDFVFGRNSDIE
jgi:hypothetical protein